MHTAFRHKRTLDLALVLKILKICMIIIIDLMAFVIDLFTFLKLCIKICRIHLTRKIGRSIIDPAVFVYLSTEKFASVSSLLTKDLCFFLVFVFLENERAALSHRIVLCLMETVAAKIADRSKSLAVAICLHALCGILNNFEVVFLRKFHDLVHLTAHTCIVDRNNRPGLVCDRLLDQVLIDIHGIRTDIYKNDLCSAKHECICS